VVGGAKSSGIEVIPYQGPVPGAIAIASGPGGGAGPFISDTDVDSGNPFATNNPVSTSGVLDPAPMSVYQSERWTSTSFTYTIAGLVPGARYEVRLHFAEIYWLGVGDRLFNVAINGQPALANFDIIAAAGGPRKAVVESFIVTADANGRITILYTNVKGGAKSSGIEVIPVLVPLI
jgi:hypothetical protein